MRNSGPNTPDALIGQGAQYKSELADEEAAAKYYEQNTKPYRERIRELESKLSAAREELDAALNRIDRLTASVKEDAIRMEQRNQERQARRDRAVDIFEGPNRYNDCINQVFIEHRRDKDARHCSKYK